jgi:hypothetical protein
VFVCVARRASAFPALCAGVLPLVTTAYYFASEARPYGLVLGFSAIALLCWQAVAPGRFRALWLVGLTSSLAATLSTHYYGIMVMLPLASGEIVRTLKRRRLDVAVWAAFACAAVPLVWHLPLIRAGTVYSGAFWARPAWVNIPDFYFTLLSPMLVPVTMILVLAAIDAMVIRAGRDGAGARVSPPVHEVAAVCGFIVIPIVCVILAKFATGAFTDRYALPAIVGFAVLGGFIVAVAFTSRPLMALVAVVCLVGWYGLARAREWVDPTSASTPVSDAALQGAVQLLRSDPERQLSLVVADPHTFTVLSHYAPPDIRSRLVYLADPDLALKRLGHNSVERGMIDLVKPWFRMNVVDYDTFVAQQPRFLVFGNVGALAFLNWLLPELQAHGMRLELRGRMGENLFLLASRDDSGDTSGPAQSSNASSAHPRGRRSSR